MCEVRLVENLIYDSEIGQAGQFDLYVPQTECGKDMPLLIYFHGGGLESGDKADDRNMYRELASGGILVASANYRMYPQVGFPVFIEDAAHAVVESLKQAKDYAEYGPVWIGGISAGGYLSMMLHFVPAYLERNGVEENGITGYIFDAGQPTVHFNVLRERGMDTGAVRVDEAAPIYYLTEPYEANLQQHFLVVSAENDIPGRPEQTELLIKTMLTHGYEKEQITYKVMPGFGHAEYVWTKDEQGNYPYARLLGDYINGKQEEYRK